MQTRHAGCWQASSWCVLHLRKALDRALGHHRVATTTIYTSYLLCICADGAGCPAVHFPISFPHCWPLLPRHPLLCSLVATKQNNCTTAAVLLKPIIMQPSALARKPCSSRCPPAGTTWQPSIAGGACSMHHQCRASRRASRRSTWCSAKKSGEPDPVVSSLKSLAGLIRPHVAVLTSALARKINRLCIR